MKWKHFLDIWAESWETKNPWMLYGNTSILEPEPTFYDALSLPDESDRNRQDRKKVMLFKS